MNSDIAMIESSCRLAAMPVSDIASPNGTIGVTIKVSDCARAMGIKVNTLRQALFGPEWNWLGVKNGRERQLNWYDFVQLWAAITIGGAGTNLRDRFDRVDNISFEILTKLASSRPQTEWFVFRRGDIENAAIGRRLVDLLEWAMVKNDGPVLDLVAIDLAGLARQCLECWHIAANVEIAA